MELRVVLLGLKVLMWLFMHGKLPLNKSHVIEAFGLVLILVATYVIEDHNHIVMNCQYIEAVFEI